MTKEQFISLIGEDPVDVLGTNWQEQMEDPGLHDCHAEGGEDGCNHSSHPQI